ncbi:MAG: hypothetical protein L0332_06775 [Chloroflexi bacterium]|nr:hypothetical protein [Chloroflexota bacterium]
MLRLCLFLLLEAAACAPPSLPARPPLADMPAFVTVYDPALCEPGVVCLQSDGDGYFASMIPVTSDWYGRMAACPREMFGTWLRLLEMELYCGDSFGMLNGVPVAAVDHAEGVGWFLRVDVFWPVAEHGLPPWNARLIWDWAWLTERPF